MPLRKRLLMALCVFVCLLGVAAATVQLMIYMGFYDPARDDQMTPAEIAMVRAIHVILMATAIPASAVLAFTHLRHKRQTAGGDRISD